jgi:hypothetical protein
MDEPRYYCFETCRGVYIGKCLTTLPEIRRTFPHSTITGNLVTVFAPPKK